MQIERIRAQIEEGKTIERQMGVLRRAILNLARLNEMSVSQLEVEKLVDFVTEYIEHAPALMMIIEEAAVSRGLQPDVQPILDATEDYFLAPEDIIPDHYGLVGLLDDAYLTHTLMQAISDSYKSQSERSLLPIEAHELNRFIRRLIGEPFVSILDDHVSTTLENLKGEQKINQILDHWSKPGDFSKHLRQIVSKSSGMLLFNLRSGCASSWITCRKIMR